MILEEAIFLVEQRLGGSTTLSDRVKIEMTALQTQLELREPTPWFLLHQMELDFSDYGYVRLPQSFIREWDDEEPALWFDTGPVPKLSWVQAQKKYPGKTDGPPQAYDLMGDRLDFFPKVTSLQKGYLWAYVREPVVADGEENAWLREVPQLLICGAGRAIAQYVSDAAALQAFERGYAEAGAIMAMHHVARHEAQRHRIFGGL